MSNTISTEAVLAYLMYSRYSYVLYKTDVELNIQLINGMLKDFNTTTDIPFEEIFKNNNNFEMRDKFVLTHIGFDKLKKMYEESIDSKILEKLDERFTIKR